jgi:N-acylneuraminate cytidylyltransferase
VIEDQRKICAIIPARGGSRGIPRKNIQQLAGKPLLAYTLESALATPSITRVIVSTDDSEIAEVSIQFGAEVIWRPEEISGEMATSESALIHALDHLYDMEKYEPELVVFLQATSPLRQSNDIQNAIETLLSEQADSLFSSCHVEGFVWRYTTGSIAPVNYDPLSRPRRQERENKLLEENGSIYIFKPWVLRKYNSRLGGKISTYQMLKIDSFQVDEPSDLELVEQLLVLRQKVDSIHLEKILLLVIDFDGVMTDNRVLVDQDGKEAVLCHRGDGWGIARLKESGVEVIVLSTETNPVVAARCHKLGIDYVQGLDNKIAALKSIAEEHSLQPEQIAYMGNDVNDLDCMHWVGVPIAVADALLEVKAVSRLITTRPGGRGAVRELANWIIAAKS